MRPGLFMVGKGGALLPANGRTQEDVRALNLAYGDLVAAQIVRSRNPRLSALVNAVLSVLADGFGVPLTTMKTKIKIELGHADLVQRPDGTIVPHPHRMRFEDMDEDQFAEFWKAAEALVCGRLLPELAREEQDAVLAIMAGRQTPKAARGKSRPR